MTERATYTGFQDQKRFASGALADVVATAKKLIDNGSVSPVLIFDDQTSRTVEVDFRGTPEHVLAKVAGLRVQTPVATAEQKTERGPGRPKLGVVAREVTLLPRHWEWLSTQPGGASVALRKLVEEARKTHQARDRAQQSQESVHRFMSVMGGDLVGYESALRAFYRGDQPAFEASIENWPEDIREHAKKLVDQALKDKAEAENEGKIAQQ